MPFFLQIKARTESSGFCKGLPAYPFWLMLQKFLFQIFKYIFYDFGCERRFKLYRGIQKKGRLLQNNP